jgi:hypothetical protein
MNEIRDILHRLAKGRPFVFVIMGYGAHKEAVFDVIRKVVNKKFDMACVRADDVLSAGHDLLSKIHDIIHRAELIIAEITDPEPGKPSPNVFYEIGYAVAMQKAPLLLVEKDHSVPTDMKGLEVIEYQDRIEGLASLRRKLSDHLSIRLSTDTAVLRDMLAASQPLPAYIVVSPKYPGARSRIKGQVFDRRTFGDHLGILGLISAFGSLYGEAKGIELISAQHAPPDLVEMDINLYLIGSRKVNSPAGDLMGKLLKDRRPRWSFDPAPEYAKKGEEGDWTVALYRTEKTQPQMMRGKAEQLGKKKEWVWTSDYGLILRGPHPRHRGRLVLFMAGAHSLGTGAACLAATSASLIKKIRERLPPGILEEKQRMFWALVKGTLTRRDYLLDEDGVSVEEAGVY